MERTIQSALDEARQIARREGVHCAAATVHNKYSQTLGGDLYDKVSKTLNREGYGAEFEAHPVTVEENG